MSPTPEVLNSIQDNPSSSVIQATEGSIDWAWAVFAIMLFSDLGFLFLTSFGRPRNPAFHQIAVMILSTSSIAWFAIASNLGRASVLTEFSPRETRDVFYARFIQYFVNAPLEILLLYLGTGYPLRLVGLNMFLVDATVVCGLVGAFIPTVYKWGFYALGVFFLLFAVLHLFFHLGRSTFPSPSGLTRGGYHSTATYLAVVYLIYPIAWGINEGANVTSVRGELIFYGILDVLAGPGWLLLYMWTHRTLGARYVDDRGTGRFVGDRSAGWTKERDGEYPRAEPAPAVDGAGT